jgi:hypothetical protein
MSRKRRFFRGWSVGSLIWIALAAVVLRPDHDLSVYLALRDAVPPAESDTGRSGEMAFLDVAAAMAEEMARAG